MSRLHFYSYTLINQLINRRDPKDHEDLLELTERQDPRVTQVFPDHRDYPAPKDQRWVDYINSATDLYLSIIIFFMLNIYICLYIICLEN